MSEQGGQQHPVSVPGAELEADGQALEGGLHGEEEETAAGTQEGDGHCLWLRAGERHIALATSGGSRTPFI